MSGSRATVLAIERDLTAHGPRPALPDRGDRRWPARRGGHLPDLLLLAGLGALGDRRGGPGQGALRAPARGGRLARPLRRGARPGLRAPPRQLSAGLHPPGADQRRLPRDRRREARRRPGRDDRRVQRDGRGPRGRLKRRFRAIAAASPPDMLPALTPRRLITAAAGRCRSSRGCPRGRGPRSRVSRSPGR